MFVGEYAGLPVSLTHGRVVAAQEPAAVEVRQRDVVVGRRGTAASESFWSVSDSSPRLCTGFETNTEAVPVELPGPGLRGDRSCGQNNAGHERSDERDDAVFHVSLPWV